jgi:GxxExxY protein
MHSVQTAKTRQTISFAHGDLTREIIGAFYRIYNHLGQGFVETVYTRSLSVELSDRGILCQLEAPLTVRYRDVVVGEFRVDLLVEDAVIIEMKAAEKLIESHSRQLRNYLKASGHSVGLLLNVGPSPMVRRMISTQ